MNVRGQGHSPYDLVVALWRQLYAPARREEAAATADAAGTSYWSALPPSAAAHRAAATMLRADADRLDPRPWRAPI